MSTPVVELLRVSTTAQQDHGSGLQAQHYANLQTAERFNLQIIKTIALDMSGSAMATSAEMGEILSMIEKRQARGLVCKESSRLMRPECFRDYGVLQTFADCGAKLFFPEGAVDLNATNDKFQLHVKFAAAGLERSLIRERCNSGKEVLRRGGKHPNGDICLPYGVGWDKQAGRYFYKPDEIAKVRQAFKMFLSGASYNEIGELLAMTHRGVRWLLSNLFYSGVRRYETKCGGPEIHSKPRGKGKPGGKIYRKQVKREAAEIIERPTGLEPIITPAEHSRVLEMIRTKAERHIRVRGKESRFTYRGHLICAECGSILYGMTSMECDYYLCKKRRLEGPKNPKAETEEEKAKGCNGAYLRRERLEESIDGALVERLTSQAFLRKMLAEQKRHVKQAKSSVGRITEQIAALEAKRGRVAEAFIDGVVDKDTRDFKLSRLDAELALAKEELLREVPTSGLTAEGLAEMLEPFAAWESLSVTERRALLAAMVADIRVGKDGSIDGVSLGAFGHEDNLHQ
jgi:DNA invertase Pin-like site-specific DNA recombinase